MRRQGGPSGLGQSPADWGYRDAQSESGQSDVFIFDVKNQTRLGVPCLSHCDSESRLSIG